MNLRRVGRKEAIGDVDCDSLFALGRKAIDQQREIDVLSLSAHALGVGFQQCELILVDHFRIVKQSPNQSRFAVIHASAGDEAQQALMQVLQQIGVDILRDERLRLSAALSLAVIHQK
jgi:hypothetical protein